ncbi:hypothetical protein GF348_24445 [candidate division KSB3 bacterium]|nr:hypothetical protein [candidate division KSB3 bacterium]
MRPSDKINLAGGIVETETGEEKEKKEEKQVTNQDVSSAQNAYLLQMMKEHQEMRQLEMQALRASIDNISKREDSSHSDSIMQVMAKQIEASNNMQVAVLQMFANARDSKGESDPVDQVARVAEIIKSNTTPASDMGQTLKTFNEFLTVRREIDDYQRGEPEDPMQMMVRTFNRGIDAWQQARKTPQQQQQSLPAPSAEQQQGQQMDKRLALLKGQVPRLEALARKARDPVLVAEVDFDSLPEQAKPYLDQLYTMENPLGSIAQAYPQLTPHAEWLNVYLGRLHQLLHPEQYQQQQPEQPQEEGGFGPPQQPDASRSGVYVYEGEEVHKQTDIEEEGAEQ